MGELHGYASRAYRDFYLRPGQLLKVLGNLSNFRQFRRYMAAGLDIVKGLNPTQFGYHSN